MEIEDKEVDKFAALRKQREEEEYQKLMESRVDPAPKGKMIYASDDKALDVANAELKNNPQHDLALHVGTDGRPIYIICKSLDSSSLNKQSLFTSPAQKAIILPSPGPTSHRRAWERRDEDFLWLGGG